MSGTPYARRWACLVKYRADGTTYHTRGYRDATAQKSPDRWDDCQQSIKSGGMVWLWPYKSDLCVIDIDYPKDGSGHRLEHAAHPDKLAWVAAQAERIAYALLDLDIPHIQFRSRSGNGVHIWAVCDLPDTTTSFLPDCPTLTNDGERVGDLLHQSHGAYLPAASFDEWHEFADQDYSEYPALTLEVLGSLFDLETPTNTGASSRNTQAYKHALRALIADDVKSFEAVREGFIADRRAGETKEDREAEWNSTIGKSAPAKAAEIKSNRTFVQTLDYDGFLQCLDAIGCKMRYNVLRLQTELLIDGKSDWIEMNDDIEHWVRQQIYAACVTNKTTSKIVTRIPVDFTDRHWRMWLGSHNTQNTFHPIEHWFAALPEWDGIERVGNILADHFNTPNTELTQWASRQLILSVVERVYIPGAKQDNTVVLIGRGGIGKSELIRNLLPPHLSDYVGTLDMSVNSKERFESMIGKAIIELDELAGKNKIERQSMLSFMTRRTDYQRLPYARRPVNNPRRCSLVGTTNDQRFLAFDTSGANRRFVPVQLSSPDGAVEAMCDEMRDQWFAECLSLHRAGTRATLPSNANSEIVQEHLAAIGAHSSINEELIDMIQTLIETRTGHDLTFREIMEEFSFKYQTYGQDYIKRHLTYMGIREPGQSPEWSAIRNKTGRFWRITSNT